MSTPGQTSEHYPTIALSANFADALASREGVTRVIDALSAERSAEMPDGRVRSIDQFAVPGDAAAILERAARAAPDGCVVETGCASALSTLHICRGRMDAGRLDAANLVHAMDPNQTRHFESMGIRHVRRAGLEGVCRVHDRAAHEVLPELLAAGTRAGFAFIDGMHQMDYVMLEAFYIDRMLGVGSVLAIHDLWMPALQHFACFWVANRGYEPVTVCGEGSAASFQTQGCESPNRGVGDPGAAPAFFRRRLLEHVDRSVLLLQKTGEDGRAWDEFREYLL